MKINLRHKAYGVSASIRHVHGHIFVLKKTHWLWEINGDSFC